MAIKMGGAASIDFYKKKFLLLTAVNQDVMLARQLVKELSFEKNWPIKRASASEDKVSTNTAFDTSQ